MAKERWLFTDDEDDETPGVLVPEVTVTDVIVAAQPPRRQTPVLEPVGPEVQPTDTPAKPAVLSVSELTAAIQGTLQAEFVSVYVCGEVSGVRKQQSGHIYFTLKDVDAQISAVLWSRTARQLKFALADGQKVVCYGSVDVYPPHGKYQLNVQRIEPVGVGAQQLALVQLEQRLRAEGLFNAARKRKLPPFPQRIGFVTSPSGAAIHDFLQVIRRRFRGVHVYVIPAKVQGPGAAADIVRGIALANRVRPALDVLVVGRGGGSIEDLWCFNEEPVVRAIFASRVPVVSAVGHEIDTTLADLVADVRALTPTEAAERVVPSASELRETLTAFSRRLRSSLLGQFTSARRHLELLARRRVLTHPLDRIQTLARRLDESALAMQNAIRRRARRNRDALVALAARLESLSPLQVLTRGYSVTQLSNGEVLRDAKQAQVGDLIRTRLAQGELISRVDETLPPQE